MLELALFSIVVGIFVKGWLGKLIVFPTIIAIYATSRTYLSAKARIVRQNRILEGRSIGVANYIFIFAYKRIISLTIAGATGLVMSFFR